MAFNFLRGDSKPGGGLFGFINKVARGDENPGGGAFGAVDSRVVKPAKKAVGFGAGLVREATVKPLTSVIQSAREAGDDNAMAVTKKAVTKLKQMSYEDRVKEVERSGFKTVLQNRGINDPTDENLDKLLNDQRAKDKSNDAGITPKSRLERAVLGNEPIQSYQVRQAGAEKELKEGTYLGSGTIGGKGIANKYAGPLSIAGVGLMAGLDLTPGGGGKGEAGEQILKKLVKASTKDEVLKVAKGLTDETASAIAKTEDINVIKNLLVDGKSQIKTPDRNLVNAVVPGAKEVSKKSTKPVKEVVARSPIESENLASLVKEGKLSGTAEEIPVNKLQKLGSGANDAYDVERIKYYKDQIQNGETLDPVIYSKDKDGTFLIEDGKHRLAAMRQMGIKNVPAVEQLPPPKKPLSGAAQQAALAKDANAASSTPFAQVSDYLNGRPASKGQAPQKGVKAISEENAALLSKQRGERFGKSAAAGAEAEGSQGYFKELEQLKGKYERTNVGGMIDNIGEQEAESLFSELRKTVRSIPDKVYDDANLMPASARLNTQTALRKVIFGENGGVPTKSELKLIRLADPNLADDVEKRIPRKRKLLDLGAQLLGLPRALQATLDLSMGGRQGLVVAARHPVQWAKANVESIKYLKDEGYFNRSMREIRNSAEFEAADRHGLALQAAMGGKEEAYAAADIAEKFPGVRRSERAYNGGLTKMRYDLWKQQLDNLGGVEMAEKLLGDKGMKDLAEVINTATGRGGKKGGLIDKHWNTLSTTLFSARLWASRLQTLNPQYYARLSPQARKVALENAGAFASLAALVLTAAAAAGADVETDARSSDFLKIKVGDTRYDVLGGFQQNLVFAWREITGQKKNSQTGKITDVKDDEFGGPTRLTFATDLVGNKLSPVFSTAGRLIEGEDRSGNPVNPATELAKLFIPLNIQGTYDTYKSTGNVAESVVKNVPSVFGVGSQTYGLKDLQLGDTQQKVVDGLKSKGAPAKEVEAHEMFFKTAKTGPDKKKAYAEIDKKIAAGDVEGAVKLAKEFNAKYKSVFDKWREQYPDYRKAESIVKEYKSGLISDTAFARRVTTLNKED